MVPPLQLELLTYSPPQVDTIWGIRGSCSIILKAIFYLLTGDYSRLRFMDLRYDGCEWLDFRGSHKVGDDFGAFVSGEQTMLPDRLPRAVSGNFPAKEVPRCLCELSSQSLVHYDDDLCPS